VLKRVFGLQKDEVSGGMENVFVKVCDFNRKC
jgi:hypothetical protein